MVMRDMVGRFLLGCVVVFSARCADAYQAIPADNLAYPVLLTLKGGGTASGFYLNSGTHMYLVTARHVLFDERTLTLRSLLATCTSYPRDPNDPNRIEIELDLKALEESKRIKYNRSHDAAIVSIATLAKAEGDAYKLSLSDGAKIIRYAKSGILGVNIANVVTFRKALVANDVFVFGYPASIGLKQVPQIEYDKPLLRKGIIAGKNQHQKTIIIDCPTYAGNSGGLVLQVEYSGLSAHFRVVGLVSQFIPFAEPLTGAYGSAALFTSNSGYSVVTPIDAVIELLGPDERKGNSADASPVVPVN